MVTAVARALWRNVLAEVEREVGAGAVDLWLAQAALVEADREEVVVFVPTPLARERLLSGRLAEAIAVAFARLLGARPRIRIEVEATMAQPFPQDGQRPSLRAGDAGGTPVPLESGDEMTLCAFVAGAENREALDAAARVCRSPGSELNPLVFCGPEGLGKTHLLTAIGRRLREDGARGVVQTTAEDFTNQFTAAIRTNATARFRERFRTAGALLIDDLHFLRGRAKTQIELLHTFEALLQAQRQIVVACEDCPKFFPDFHPGLVGRLLAGLVVTIEPPAVETRRKILEARATRLAVRLAPEVLDFLAENVTRSVRDLCGALAVLRAHASIGERVDVALARRRLGGFLAPEPPPAPERRIVEIVAAEFSLDPGAIAGGARRAEAVLARQVAMYLVRRLTRLSLREIGALFGRKPSTVTFAGAKVEGLIAKDERVRRVVEEATRRFAGESS